MGQANNVLDTAVDLIPAAAYLRRSTEHQEQSLGDQRKAASEYASEHGYDIVAEYVDDAVSGTSAKGRKGFLSMIGAAKSGLFKTVIVWNSDRFSRGDVTETEHYRYLLREAGVTVVSITEDYLHKEGIEGDVLRTVKQFQNRQYSVSLAQNALRGMISSFEESDPGRIAPYGYDREILAPNGSLMYRVRNAPGEVREIYNADGKLQGRYEKGQSFLKPGKDCRARLTEGPNEQVETLQRIFRLCIDGRGFSFVANRLNENGIPSPRGGKWSHTTIKAILENPVYYGAAVFNRRTKAKFFGVRKGRITKSPNSPYTRLEPKEWLVREDAHPALVDKATWERAQSSVRERARKSGGQGKTANRYLLSGLIYCADCGRLYWGERRRSGQGRISAAYFCSGRHTHGKSVCPVPGRLSCPDLESFALSVVKQAVLGDHKTIEAAADAFVAAALREQQRDGGGLRLTEIEHELKETDSTVKALTARIDPTNLDLLNDRLTELRQKKERLERESTALEQAAPKQSPTELREEFVARLQLLDETMSGRSDEASRQLLASYIRRIEYSPSQNQGILILQPGLTLPPSPDDDSGGSSADSGGTAEVAKTETKDSAIESLSYTDVSGEGGLVSPATTEQVSLPTTSRQLDLFAIEEDNPPENGDESSNVAKSVPGAIECVHRQEMKCRNSSDIAKTGSKADGHGHRQGVQVWESSGGARQGTFGKDKRRQEMQGGTSNDDAEKCGSNARKEVASLINDIGANSTGNPPITHSAKTGARKSTIIPIKNAVPEPSGTACRSGAGDPVFRLHASNDAVFGRFSKVPRVPEWQFSLAETKIVESGQS